MTSTDYRTISYDNDAGTRTIIIEKLKWDWPRKNKQVHLTGTFYQALQEADRLKQQKEEQEKAPF